MLNGKPCQVKDTVSMSALECYILFFQGEEEVEEVTDSFVPLTNEMERMVSPSDLRFAG